MQDFSEKNDDITDHQDSHSKVLVRLLRLSKKADKLLRDKVARRGDVTRRVHEAIAGVNWNDMVVEPRKKARGNREDFFSTSVSFTEEQYDNLSGCAKTKGVSVSVLVDALIVKFFSRPKK